MLKDKVAIVTGASRGIGQAIALEFARNGARLAVCSRSEETIKDTRSAIEGLGAEVLAKAVDVSNQEDVDSFIKDVQEKFGSIDIVVNNAGITRDQLIMRMSNDDWNDVININLKGVYNFCKAVARPMLRQRGGNIINITSVVGLTGNPGQVNYAASKAGIIGITKSLAKELSAKNVRVNAIAPGFIRTEMTDKLSEDQQKQLLNVIPMKRMGEADEIAKAALYLASEMSTYMTGQTLVVDGGMVMQ